MRPLNIAAIAVLAGGISTLGFGLWLNMNYQRINELIEKGEYCNDVITQEKTSIPLCASPDSGMNYMVGGTFASAIGGILIGLARSTKPMTAK
jgi:tetrahydromethanopterin S-methyltransferase subunit B